MELNAAQNLFLWLCGWIIWSFASAYWCCIHIKQYNIQNNIANHMGEKNKTHIKIKKRNNFIMTFKIICIVKNIIPLWKSLCTYATNLYENKYSNNKNVNVFYGGWKFCYNNNSKSFVVSKLTNTQLCTQISNKYRISFCV